MQRLAKFCRNRVPPGGTSRRRGLGQRARGAPFPSNVIRVPDFQPGLMSTLSVSCGEDRRSVSGLAAFSYSGTPALLHPLQSVQRSDPQRCRAGGYDELCTHGQMHNDRQARRACTLWLFPLPSITERLIFSRLVAPCAAHAGSVGSRSSPAARPGAAARGAAAGGWGGRPPGRAPPACRSRRAQSAHPCARSCRACRPCRPRARRRRRRPACRQSRPACRACRPCPACRRRPRRPYRRTALRPRPLRPPAMERAAAQPGHAVDRRLSLLQALGPPRTGEAPAPPPRPNAAPNRLPSGSPPRAPPAPDAHVAPLPPRPRPARLAAWRRRGPAHRPGCPQSPARRQRGCARRRTAARPPG